MTLDSVTLKIERLGSAGDGLALVDGTPVYVEGALPGEVVVATLDGRRARITRIETVSNERATPVCPSYDTCGGCQLQHLVPAYEDRFKRALLNHALKREGVVHPAPEATIAGGKRRRAVLSALREGNRLSLGFNGRASHKIVTPTGCTVLDPRLLSALPALEPIAAIVARADGATRISVLASESGLDVAVLEAARGAIDARNRLLKLAMDAGLARLTLEGEIIAQQVAPVLSFGRAPVTVPPGGFTQASIEAELAMVALVMEATGKAKAVADLFAGSGTFALRLAEKAKVHAVEGDAAALAALAAGWKAAGGLKPVTTERRDLLRAPLAVKELNAYEAVVFDPPRAGAEAQARSLAASTVPTVVAVSCAPETLARDLSILTAGGYTIERIVPVDQFRHAAHLEAVAVLRKEIARHKGPRGRAAKARETMKAIGKAR